MYNFCKAPIYIKTKQYSAPTLAPTTRAEELKQELLNITGEAYVLLSNEYCPMCGDNLVKEMVGDAE